MLLCKTFKTNRYWFRDDVDSATHVSRGSVSINSAIRALITICVQLLLVIFFVISYRLMSFIRGTISIPASKCVRYFYEEVNVTTAVLCASFLDFSDREYERTSHNSNNNFYQWCTVIFNCTLCNKEKIRKISRRERAEDRNSRIGLELLELRFRIWRILKIFRSSHGQSGIHTSRFHTDDLMRSREKINWIKSEQRCWCSVGVGISIHTSYLYSISLYKHGFDHF